MFDKKRYPARSLRERREQIPARKASSLEEEFDRIWKERETLLPAYLWRNVPPMVAEYPFHPALQSALDRAMPGIKVAIELEGLPSNLGGKRSRHLSPTGYSRDCEKYNEATLMGWVVLRFTAIQLKDKVNVLRVILEACERRMNAKRAFIVKGNMVFVKPLSAYDDVSFSLEDMTGREWLGLLKMSVEEDD